MYLHYSGLFRPGQTTERKKKNITKRDKYLDAVRELKITMVYESDGDTNCN